MDLFSHQERSIKCRFNKLERNRIFHRAKFHVVATKNKKKNRIQRCLLISEVCYSFVFYKFLGLAACPQN